MKTRWIGVAVTALAVGAGPAWAGGDIADPSAGTNQPEAKRAASLTASAWAALAKGDAVKAVHDAEAATMLLPGDAGTRVLLGRAYLAAGRFNSSETAFSDALTLDPALAKAAISRALAQIALGKPDDARASLAIAEGSAPDADIGLAEALLGDGATALKRLDTAARAPGADARTRQNLGLVYALEGRWVDAAAIAQQDVPADLMPQRIRRWAMIAQLKADPAMQVGAILGVLPASDSGQPTALALAAPSPVPVASVAPVMLAEATPLPAVPVQIASPMAAPIMPIVRTEGDAVVTQINLAPPSLEALVTVPATMPLMASPVIEPLLAIATPDPAPAPAVAVAPVTMAFAGPPRMRPAKAPPAPARWVAAQSLELKPVKAAKPAPVLLAAVIKAKAPRNLQLASHVTLKPAGRDMGSWAVQLGAFSSVNRTQIAWGKLSGRAGYLNAYKPTGSGRRLGKAMIYRLSVSGLPTRQEAVKLCLRIRASGGSCFVRNGGGDLPMQWAARSRADQPA